MKNILFFLLIFSSLHLAGQEKMKLINFKTIGLCDSTEIFLDKVRPTIIQKKFGYKNLAITIRTRTNCIYDKYIGAFQVKNDTLNLLYTVKDCILREEDVIYQEGENPTQNTIEEVLCDCYVEIQYEFSNVDRQKKIMLFSKILYPENELYQTQTPTFEIFEKDTVNYTDSIDYKQGRWIYLNGNNKIISEEFYKNGEAEYYKDISYYSNGKIHTESIMGDKSYELKYFKNGKIKQECLTQKEFIQTSPYNVKTTSEPIFLEGSLLLEVEICVDYNKDGEIVKKSIRIIE
ncbi:MAG: hypothetical protein ABFS35_07590 [Bacteroidota bacterium]